MKGSEGRRGGLGGIKTSFVLSSRSEQEIFLSCRRLLLQPDCGTLVCARADATFWF